MIFKYKYVILLFLSVYLSKNTLVGVESPSKRDNVNG